MANSNLIQWPLLPENERRIQAGDVLLLLRGGLPFRYVVEEPLDLTVTANAITLPSALEAEVVNDYEWLDVFTGISGGTRQSFSVRVLNLFSAVLNVSITVGSDLRMTRDRSILSLTDSSGNPITVTSARLRRAYP